jgi:hypothetical protein
MTMQRWLKLCETFCDPAREDEFNEWCDRIEVPEMLATPGFVRARRYVQREQRDGRGKYMTLYDVETDDIEVTMRRRQARAAAKPPADLVFPLWRDVLFRETFERGDAAAAGRAEWLNLVEQNCDPRREAEYHDWYNNMHIPDILATPGFVSARRYEIKEFRDGRGKYLAVYQVDTADIDATMTLRLEKRAEEVKLGRASATRANLTRLVWRDVLWKRISQQEARR